MTISIIDKSTLFTGAYIPRTKKMFWFVSDQSDLCNMGFHDWQGYEKQDSNGTSIDWTECKWCELNWNYRQLK